MIILSLMFLLREIFATFSYWTSSLIVPIFFSIYPQYIPINPSPTLGLCLGLSSVLVGQVTTVAFHRYYSYNLSNNYSPHKTYDFYKELREHLFSQEGLIMFAVYLTFTWNYKLMHDSYYGFYGGIIWPHVFSQLIIQDLFQYGMHRIEHAIYLFYRFTHKRHHQYTSPILFDAFRGSFSDSFFMIIIPLFLTSRIIHTNVWSYMVFGTIYANMLLLIHSEYSHPWDPLFQYCGLATSAFHRVHHKLFVYNYGHIFTCWDIFFNTYKAPIDTVEQ